MDNRTKQQVAILNRRILRLENIIENISMSLQCVDMTPNFCIKCNAYDPINTNYVCCQEDCCMGLNTEDDKE